MLTIELTGYRDVEGTLWLLNFFPSDAGQLPGGGFNVDAWDDAKTFVSAIPGADVRAAFREAYRRARIEARKHGGLEFMQTTFDDEPCPLPDLVPNALAAPAVVLDDGGTSYRSPVNLSGEERLELGRLDWIDQLKRVRALVNEAIEKEKDFSEFETVLKDIFPGGFAGNC